MSKGSRRRPGDDAAYAAGYERIFGAAKRYEDAPKGLLGEILASSTPLSDELAKTWARRNPTWKPDDDSEPKPKNQ